MYQISGSVLSDEMEVLTGVEIEEINVFGFPGSKTKTDQDGKFKLTVTAADTEIKISHFGFITVIMKAKDFNVDSLAYLIPAITVTGTKKDNNALLYLLLAASAVTIIILATRKAPKPQPKQVKIA